MKVIICLALFGAGARAVSDVLDVLEPGRQLSHQASTTWSAGYYAPTNTAWSGGTGQMCPHQEFYCVGNDIIGGRFWKNNKDRNFDKCCTQCNRNSGGNIGKNNCVHNSAKCKCGVCYGSNPESPYACNNPWGNGPMPTGWTLNPSTTTTSTLPPTPLPLPAPSSVPLPAPSLPPTPQPTSFKDEVCEGEDINRYPDLGSCCRDIANHGELTDFLKDLTGDALTTFQGVCAGSR